ADATNAYVFKDSKGLVWISSIAGLFQYDGQRIIAFYPQPLDSCSLADENIQSTFYEDDNQNIWFSTFQALHVYNRKANCFEHFVTPEDENSGNTPGYY